MGSLNIANLSILLKRSTYLIQSVSILRPFYLKKTDKIIQKFPWITRGLSKQCWKWVTLPKVFDFKLLILKFVIQIQQPKHQGLQ